MEKEKAGLSGEQYEGIVSNSAERSRTERRILEVATTPLPLLFPPPKPTIHNTQYTQYNTIQHNTLKQSNQKIN